jgi:uncharacterized protein with HEPN domain
MADAAREASSFARGRSRADMDTDRMLVLSLVKEIEIIGEAASKVSQETRDLLPDIPMAGFDWHAAPAHPCLCRYQ